MSVDCKNPLNLYPHGILESSSNLGKYFDRLGYCGICRALAFTDNMGPTNPEPIRKSKSFPDSKINKRSGPCSNDTL